MPLRLRRDARHSVSALPPRSRRTADSVVSAERQQISTNQAIGAGNCNQFFVATGPITLTVVRANTLWSGYGFWVYAISGVVTVAINSNDNFLGQSSGVSLVIPQGTFAFINTNAASSGTWYETPSPAPPKWATSGRPSSPIAGQYGYNTTFNGIDVWNGSQWFTLGVVPTVYSLNSGSGNYTPTAPNVLYAEVWMCAGGGGGGGSDGNGSNGTLSSFGSWTANPGLPGGGAEGNGGVGGTGGTNGTGTLIQRFSGNPGQSGFAVTNTALAAFGMDTLGGRTMLAPYGNGGDGGGAKTSSGSGTVTLPGAGGGGECVWFEVQNPNASAPIAWAVGSGGNPGPGGGSFGSPGRTIIKEHYS
jgi:hypothetical protein